MNNIKEDIIQYFKDNYNYTYIDEDDVVSEMSYFLENLKDWGIVDNSKHKDMQIKFNEIFFEE